MLFYVLLMLFYTVNQIDHFMENSKQFCIDVLAINIYSLKKYDEKYLMEVSPYISNCYNIS